MTGWSTQGLGERVRRLRTSRGVTLKQVEAAVGISATHVSEIERGKTSPTIGALAKIASALKVDMAFLLEDSGGEVFHVAVPDERATLAIADGRLRLTPLSNTEPGIELSVFEVTIRSGEAVNPRPSRRWGEEVVIGIGGVLEVSLEGRVDSVRAGETVHVRGNGVLRFRSLAEGAARVIWATYPKFVL